MSAPVYKLMYFNARGFGENARMLFALKGQEFEDYRFKEGEFAQIKGNTDVFPLGQAPVLLIDGKPVPQSRAIARTLARNFNLYGANNEEASRIDVICETVLDVTQLLMKVYRTQDAEKAEAKISVKDDTSKRYLNYLNSAIKQNGGRFFVGNSETLADVMTFTMLDGFCSMLDLTDDFINTNYPDLGKFKQGIRDNSKLSDYIKNRP